MSKKNGLATTARRRPQIKEYMEDGYKVVETIFPDSNTYMITKEKGDNVFYYYRTPSTCTKGMYNKAEFEKRMNDFNRQMDDWQSEYKRRLDNWDVQCEEWNKKLDERLKSSFGTGSMSFPDFPDFPEIPSFPQYSDPFPGVSQTVIHSNRDDTDFGKLFGEMFDDILLDDTTPNNTHRDFSRTTQRSHYNNRSTEHYVKTSSSTGSCLGCLIWTILILGVFCIILYAMGIVGGNIIHFIANLFKSLF